MGCVLAGDRPRVPPPQACRGFGGYRAYVALLEECWAQVRGLAGVEVGVRRAGRKRRGRVGGRDRGRGARGLAPAAAPPCPAPLP